MDDYGIQTRFSSWREYANQQYVYQPQTFLFLANALQLAGREANQHSRIYCFGSWLCASLESATRKTASLWTEPANCNDMP